MSAATIKGIKDAIQAHIDEGRDPGDQAEFLLEVVIGYVAMVVQPDGGERYSYKYIVDPNATPHSSVGLFAMASSQLDLDLDPK
jgi:hypothetical protein